ncbi:unnamed protein product [Rangifer tarandus platyrhynchus]|uniref:Uncharacterized protein n=2 Tax=Rangifer tarandus platyrhynchus TaxID=3082113 RepID=A0ABN8YMY4_RANTA|nr:unnamed protein product [Rangifer tarandus platyrhynchus]
MARTAPAKGQGQKSSFQSLPGSGFSISAYWNGWKWPEVPTGTCWAYSWTREIIELSTGDGVRALGPVLPQNSVPGHTLKVAAFSWSPLGSRLAAQRPQSIRKVVSCL